MNPASRVAAVLAASSLAVGLLAPFEGLELVGYRDIAGVSTACYGSTKNVVIGKRYSTEECLDRLAEDVVAHGLKIASCIKVEAPPESQAAFISFAYNVGTANFCGSTMARKLNAGDLAGACAELSRWTYVAKKDCRDPANRCSGIVRRRAAERAMCERGLTP